MARLDFDRKNLSADIGAAATMALVAVPDGIASAFLAGVSPWFAFSALIAGAPLGSLFTSSQYMNIGVTAAMMLAVRGGLARFRPVEILPAMVTLTILIGIFQLLLGLFKLGSFTRFISNAVMVGFTKGIAVILILGQLGHLTGYNEGSSHVVMQTVELFLNLDQVNGPSLLTGLAAIMIIVSLRRTRLRNFSLAIALLLTSAAVTLLGLNSVMLVGDAFQLSGFIPTPALPNLPMIRPLILTAVAVGLLGLIQGAGVSQSIPNPDGQYPDPSGDFRGQGIANIVSGFFKGLPLGGAASFTRILISAGAKSRWANVMVGLFVAVFLLIFGDQLENVAVPAVAAILIVIGFSGLRIEPVAEVWRVNVASRLVMIVTFVLTLTIGIQEAVLIGVVLSILHYVYTSARDVQLLELVQNEAGEFVERPCPKELSDNSITILTTWGALFFASARTLDEMLPDARNARHAVVIFRMHGRSRVGSTFLLIMERYARRLSANNGKLMISGVSQVVHSQLQGTKLFAIIPETDVFLVEDTMGASTGKAMKAAGAWLSQPPQELA